MTPEEIEKEVEGAISTVKDDLKEKRYRYPIGQLMAEIRKKIPWADGKAVKSEIDVQVLDLLGPKTEADLAPPPKKDKKSGKGDKNDTNKKDQINKKDSKGWIGFTL